VHGAMPWTPKDRPRRVCLYRFAPATNAYGRSYFHRSDNDDDTLLMGWPRAMYEGLDEAQRAVLEPPYANRLDRPNIRPEDGSIEIPRRSVAKRQHDRNVFGTDYF
jgi:hypothetical protein